MSCIPRPRSQFLSMNVLSYQGFDLIQFSGFCLRLSNDRHQPFCQITTVIHVFVALQCLHGVPLAEQFVYMGLGEDGYRWFSVMMAWNGLLLNLPFSTNGLLLFFVASKFLSVGCQPWLTWGMLQLLEQIQKQYVTENILEHMRSLKSDRRDRERKFVNRFIQNQHQFIVKRAWAPQALGQNFC